MVDVQLALSCGHGDIEADSSEMREWAEQLVARAHNEGIELTGDNG